MINKEDVIAAVKSNVGVGMSMAMGRALQKTTKNIKE